MFPLVPRDVASGREIRMTRARGLVVLLGLLTGSALAYGCSSSSTNPNGHGGGGSGGAAADGGVNDASDGGSTDASDGGPSDAGDGGPSDAGDGGPTIVLFDPSGTDSPDAIYWDDAK